MISKDELNLRPSEVYSFNEFRFEVVSRLLFRDSEVVSLAPKAGEVLLALVESGGKLVTKQEILDRVWADTFVEEANLAQHISALRKALGEDKNGRRFIETVPRKGYRFIAPIKREPDESIEFSIRERVLTTIVEEQELEDESEKNQTTKVQTGAPPAVQQIPMPAAPHYRANNLSRLMIGLAILTLTTLTLAGIYWFLLRKSPIVFHPGGVRRLTTSGRAGAPKISPDGRYILYLQRDGGGRSIWLRQIATDSDVRVTAPTANEDVFGGITFSPDGDYIYYSLKRRGEKINTLYRIPSLGGAPKKISENLIGAISFSPDGRQFAFLRPTGNGDFLLMSGDADGANERVIAERQRPFHFSGALAWSPDGKTILCSAFGGGENFHYEFVAVDAVSGAALTMPSQKNWQADDSIVWLPDGNSFLFIGQSESSTANQIWQIDYPNGAARQITNDADRYASISLTSNGRWLTAGKLNQESHLWLTGGGVETDAKQITGGANNYDGIGGLRWMPDNRIVYQSKASGADAIWMIDRDGGAARKIADGTNPAVSPDGRLMVFQNKNNQGLWLLDLSDNSLRRLTDQTDFTPAFAPGGRWIYFCRFESQTNIYRIAAEGGAAQLVTDEFRTTSSPSVSPDGKFLAFAYGKALKDPNAPPSGAAFINLETNRITKTFDIPEFKFGGYYEQPTLQWTADGGALEYIVLRDGASNIWRQSVTDGDRAPITNFKDLRIFNFNFSPDGQQIVLARGRVNSDVVLIENGE